MGGSSDDLGIPQLFFVGRVADMILIPETPGYVVSRAPANEACRILDGVAVRSQW
jgi:hypothetical protein